MPRTPTTPAQISGHRFLVRRVEHALVRADSRMLHDPLRTRGRAMAAGTALVVILLAGTVILGLVRPRDGSADADLVLVRDSGALHVRVDDRLHPVANLASARLVLGQPVTPTRVGAGAVAGALAHAADGSGGAGGHGIGIPGAPPVVVAGPPPAPPAVGVCEETASGLRGPVTVRTTIARTGALPRPERRAVVLTDGAESWFVAGGRRARIDVADPALSRALRLSAAPVRPAGPALLEAIPEVAPIAAPRIAQHGAPTGFDAPFDVVGTVVAVGERRVVVLDDGAADLGPVPADVVAAAGSTARATEAQLAAVPISAGFDAGSLPEDVPEWAPAEGWLCVDADAETTVVTHGAAPTGVIAYPGADGAGPGVDGYSPGEPQTVAVDTGGGVHLVSPDGVRHLVENRRALAALGYGSTVPVPWRVLSALREGPELTRGAALSAMSSTPRTTHSGLPR